MKDGPQNHGCIGVIFRSSSSIDGFQSFDSEFLESRKSGKHPPRLVVSAGTAPDERLFPVDSCSQRLPEPYQGTS